MLKITLLPTVAALFASCSFAATATHHFTKRDGLPNFYRVNEQVYRGGQPTDQGFQNLAKIGVKTIIDLREPGDRAGHEKAVVEKLGMRYLSIPISPHGSPEAGRLDRILELMNSPSDGPVFVHCRRGADRTGVVVACYRISHDGWENVRAKQEAVDDGMSIFQLPKKFFIMSYRPSANVQAASAKPPSAPMAVIPASASAH